MFFVVHPERNDGRFTVRRHSGYSFKTMFHSGNIKVHNNLNGLNACVYALASTTNISSLHRCASTSQPAGQLD